MPYITRIQIEQCRNVLDLEIDLSVPTHASQSGAAGQPRFRHLILTGPNGSGKSGILEAIGGEVDKAITPHPQLSLFGIERERIEWNAHPRTIPRMFANGDVIGVYLSARRRID